MPDITADTTPSAAAAPLPRAVAAAAPADDANSQPIVDGAPVETTPEGPVTPYAALGDGETDENPGPDNAGQMAQQIDDYAVISQRSVYANTRFA